MNLMELINNLNEFIKYYGPLGVFIISFVGNAIPYATLPYLAIIAAMASQMHISLIDALVWSLLGGLGAALGKVVVYLTGLATSEILPERVKENMQIFARLAKRGIFIAIFLFAALPLPDDILYIPLGMSKYPITKFFIAVWLGKIIITFLSIVFGNTYGNVMSQYHINEGESIVSLIIITVIFSIIIARIDWLQVGVAITERGLGYATVVFFNELLKALGLKRIINKVIDRDKKKSGTKRKT